jgi:hypothetical protein
MYNSSGPLLDGEGSSKDVAESKPAGLCHCIVEGGTDTAYRTLAVGDTIYTLKAPDERAAPVAVCIPA